MTGRLQCSTTLLWTGIVETQHRFGYDGVKRNVKHNNGFVNWDLSIHSQSTKCIAFKCFLHVFSLKITHVGWKMLGSLTPLLDCVNSYNLYNWK